MSSLTSGSWEENMTVKCIKNEMRKALFSRAALITYLLSFSIVIYHTVTKAQIYNEFYAAYQGGETERGIP